MGLVYFLLDLAPFAPMLVIVAATTAWLRKERWAWVGAGLVAAGVLGTFLTFYLRDVGFHAYGGVCSADKARGFMQAMQYVFLADGALPVVGGSVLTAIALRRSRLVGALLLAGLTAASLMSGVFVYFASGMTAVDTYAC